MERHRKDRKLLLLVFAGCLVALVVVCASPTAWGAGSERTWQQGGDAADATATYISTLMTHQAEIFATKTESARLSATPTYTPRPTSTPTPRRAVQPFAEVLLGEVSIRSGPGLAYETIGRASVGQQLFVSGKTSACQWLQVLLEDGSAGWVTGEAAYVRLNVACGNIRTVAVPPAPASTSVAIPTATSRPAVPTNTSRPAVPTNTSRPPQTPAPVAPQAPAPVAPPANIPAGVITSFEPLGNWRRGDEPYGTFTQSTAQVAHGNASAQLSYDFPAAAGGKSYVVFLAQSALSLGSAQQLQAQVYGDGSGHILNAWVRDAGGQIWQTTFGFIKHVGWAPMSATLSASREWPNGPISASSDQLTPPLSLYALVLDGVPDGTASAGSIYLDALTTDGAVAAAVASAPSSGTGAAASAPAVESAVPAPAAEAPVAVPSGPLGGKIAFSRFNGTTMDTLVYDVAAGHIIANHPNMRQPDLAGGYLLVNGEGGGNESIMRMTVGGDSKRPLTLNTEDAFPQWSPSTESMVYASEKGGDRKARLYFHVDASDEQNVDPILYNGREIFGDYPVYLDNWRIAFQGCDSWAGGSRCGIYTGDARGGAPTRLTDQTSDIPSGNLGSDVIFSSPRAGNWDVWAVDAGGGNLRQLTTDPAIDGLGVASPDKTSIAFVSNRGGSWAVWVMNVDGSNQRKLFDIEGTYGGGDYDWIRERISWGQ